MGSIFSFFKSADGKVEIENQENQTSKSVSVLVDDENKITIDADTLVNGLIANKVVSTEICVEPVVEIVKIVDESIVQHVEIQLDNQDIKLECEETKNVMVSEESKEISCNQPDTIESKNESNDLTIDEPILLQSVKLVDESNEENEAKVIIESKIFEETLQNVLSTNLFLKNENSMDIVCASKEGESLKQEIEQINEPSLNEIKHTEESNTDIQERDLTENNDATELVENARNESAREEEEKVKESNDSSCMIS